MADNAKRKQTKANEKRHNAVTPWDRPGVAEEIDAYWATSEEGDFRRMVVDDLAPRLQSGDVLEVGCGSGRIYGALVEAGCLAGRLYRGLDVSPAMLALARRRYPQALFDVGDVLALEAQADNVLCIQVLQHLEEWQPALERLLAASRRMLYVVSWFGHPSRHFDAQAGIWNNWLDADVFVEACRAHGVVTTHDFGANSLAAIEVRK